MSGLYGNIIGWGKYVPETVVTNADLEEVLDTSDEWIVTRTGIRERRIVKDGETTSTMATAASRQALQVAGIHPRDLDLIILATSSPDYLTPPASAQVQHDLGARHAASFCLVNGCTGFLYGLTTAQQYIASGKYQNILIIGAELISRYVNWNDRNTCVLFGDGAGAVVVQGTEVPSGVLSYVLGSDGSGGKFLIIPGGGSAFPPSKAMLEQELQYLQMDGRRVAKFATRVLGKALSEAIQEAGLTTEDIDLFIPHQANARIIEAASKQVGLPDEKVFMNIHKYGNTSAASIPIAFCEAMESHRARLGDTIAFVAFGAGLTWAATILRIAPREAPKPSRFWQLPILSRFGGNGRSRMRLLRSRE